MPSLSICDWGIQFKNSVPRSIFTQLSCPWRTVPAWPIKANSFPQTIAWWCWGFLEVLILCRWHYCSRPQMHLCWCLKQMRVKHRKTAHKDLPLKTWKQACTKRIHSYSIWHCCVDGFSFTCAFVRPTRSFYGARFVHGRRHRLRRSLSFRWKSKDLQFWADACCQWCRWSVADGAQAWPSPLLVSGFESSANGLLFQFLAMHLRYGEVIVLFQLFQHPLNPSWICAVFVWIIAAPWRFFSGRVCGRKFRTNSFISMRSPQSWC